jgi:hypothetical protein
VILCLILKAVIGASTCIRYPVSGAVDGAKDLQLMMPPSGIHKAVIHAVRPDSQVSEKRGGE